MTVPVSTDMVFFQSEEWSAVSTNGGRMSDTQITDDSVNNVWPHILKDERDNGGDLYRKVYAKLHQDSDGSLVSPQFCLYGPTLGDDYMRFFPGTQIDTEADWTIATEDPVFSAAGIKTLISAGAGSVVITLKHADQADAFPDGATILITDKDDPDGTGNEELHVINGTPSLVTLDLTITLTGTTTNGYAAYSAGTGGKVASVYEPTDDIESTFDTVTQSRADTIDLTTYPLAFNNMGTIEDTITFTFTDATQFTVSSAELGALASGSKSADYEPQHPTWSKDLFSLPMAAFVGTTTNQAGDTFSFKTHPASVPLVEHRETPAGSSPLSDNQIILYEMAEAVA